MSVFRIEERQRYNQLRTELMANLQIEEMSCGYALFYPNQPSLIMKVAEWMSYESRCCPFLNISLLTCGETENIRVELTGNEIVKNFLREEFSLV